MDVEGQGTRQGLIGSVGADGDEGRIVGRTNPFRLLGPVVLSCLGPIYFACANIRYSIAIVWALACTLCWVLAAFKAALVDINWIQPFWYKATVIAALVAIFAFAFVAADSFTYLLARSISDDGFVGQRAASSAACAADCDSRTISGTNRTDRSTTALWSLPR